MQADAQQAEIPVSRGHGVSGTARLGAESPSVVRVITLTWYVVPLARPVIVQLTVPDVTQWAPPGLAVAV